MAFLQEELRNYTFKAMNGILSTGSRSTAPDNLTYYEEMTTGNMPVMPNQIYGQIDLVPPAPTRADAVTNSTTLPNIIREVKVQLTPSLNSKAFFCTETFGNLSTRFGNFIMPQMVPRTDAGNVGRASIGYTAKLFQGDPDSGGSEITTTAEQSGADVGWLFNYGAGAIIVASDFTNITNPNDVWLTGFQYVGETGSTGGDVLVDDITIETSLGLEKMSTTGYYPYDIIRDYWFPGVTKGVDDPDDFGSWQCPGAADGVIQCIPNSTFMMNYNDSDPAVAVWPIGIYSLYSNRDLAGTGLKIVDSTSGPDETIYATFDGKVNGLFKYSFNINISFIVSFMTLEVALTEPFVFMLIDKVNPELGDKITIKHIDAIIDSNELSIDGSSMVASDGTKELPTRRYVDSKIGTGDDVTIQAIIGEPEIKIVSDFGDMIHDAWDPTLPGTSGWSIGPRVTYDNTTGTAILDYVDSDLNSPTIFHGASFPYSKTGQAGIYRFTSSLDLDALGFRARIRQTTSYHYKKELLPSGRFMYSIFSGKNTTFEGFAIEGPGGIDATIDIQFVDANLYPPVNVYKIEEIDHIIDNDFKSIDPTDVPMVDSHRELVTRAYVDDKATSVAYTQQFTQADLVSGYLSVPHMLKALYNVCNVTIMNENYEKIDPDGIKFDTQDLLTIDMRMLDPLTGVWSVVVNTYAEPEDVIPPVQPAYINGPYINGHQLN